MEWRLAPCIVNQGINILKLFPKMLIILHNAVVITWGQLIEPYRNTGVAPKLQDTLKEESGGNKISDMAPSPIHLCAPVDGLDVIGCLFVQVYSYPARSLEGHMTLAQRKQSRA